MIAKYSKMLLHVFIWFFITAKTESGRTGKLSKQSADISHSTENVNLSGIASIFSPRMDFDQWKPLTGRGDPLRNDPTYDYEPPVLERVHYWADEIHSHREKYPEKKSEVLVLGVSSRKPSVGSKPLASVRRQPQPLVFPSKYEDFSYKFSDHYPMTILVPPPPPPPSRQPSLFVEDKLILNTLSPKLFETTLATRETTRAPEILTSFALQESNLIYQASTTKQNWFNNYNKTTNLPNNTVSSDYAGWGPTTPFEDTNEVHNIIPHTDVYNKEFIKHPLSYYKPVFSEAPPPPQVPTISHSIDIPTFLPTVLPPTLLTASNTQDTWPTTEATQEITTNTIDYNTESTTEKDLIKPSQIIRESSDLSKIKPHIIDMLGSMISMPLVPDPERPEDNLYAHASDSIQVYKSPPTENSASLEIMQTMQPPPPVFTESSTVPPRHYHINSHIQNNIYHDKPITHTHDPYLHMRFTTPITTTAKTLQDIKSTTESSSIPSYLIIQGHSKVKTYGSKPKSNEVIQNEIPNPNETNEVKHLHPIKDKNIKSEKKQTIRASRAHNLRSLIDIGLGSIEIQEADVGIKYDVSDGSEVPVEIYKKGIIVDSYENNYPNKKVEKRSKRQTTKNEHDFYIDNDSLEKIIKFMF